MAIDRLIFKFHLIQKRVSMSGFEWYGHSFLEIFISKDADTVEDVRKKTNTNVVRGIDRPFEIDAILLRMISN